MPEPLRIASLLRLPEDAQTAIRALDPRIDLRALRSDARRRFLNPRSEVADAAAAETEIAWALDQADVWYTLPYDGLRFNPAGPLRWIQTPSAGVERLLQRDIPSGVLVTNARGMHAGPIGEWVLAFILMHAKQMPAALSNQRAQRWQRYTVTNLRGATVGVVGLGAIGAEVARLSAAFGARVVAIQRSAAPGATAPHCDALYPPDELDRLLAESDYVVLAVPLTTETTNLIGAHEVAQMKPSGVLVNIARGAVVDWHAMLAALRDERIGAVYTDVTVPEPLPDGDPAWSTPNMVITPHNSGTFPNERDVAARIFVDNVRRYVRGEPLQNLVDRARGY